MANWYEPTSEQLIEWESWLAGRPEVVREAARRFPPWKLYRINSGHRVYPLAFAEPEGDQGVTVRVAVTGRFNALAFEREVFGIPAEELVECDLPGPDEVLGSADFELVIGDLIDLGTLNEPFEGEESS